MKLRLPIFIGLASLLGLHVTMTVLYVCPPNIIKNQLAKYVNAYINPVFNQNWHLFSPNPGLESRYIWVKCSQDNQAWTDWKDPFAHVQRAADANPMGGHTKLMYVYRYAAAQYQDAIEAIISAKNARNEPVTKAQAIELARVSAEHGHLERLSLAICQKHFKRSDALYARFSVLSFAPKKYSERNSKSRWGSIKEYTSPVIEKKYEG